MDISNNVLNAIYAVLGTIIAITLILVAIKGKFKTPLGEFEFGKKQETKPNQTPSKINRNEGGEISIDSNNKGKTSKSNQPHEIIGNKNTIIKIGSDNESK